MTPEEMLAEGERAISMMRSGEWYLQLAAKYGGHRGRKYREKGLTLIQQGQGHFKWLQNVAGRLKKKMKTRKKYTKVVTLTEINGIPWRILVKK